MGSVRQLTQWGLCTPSRNILHGDLLAANIERAVLRAAGQKQLDDWWETGPALFTLSQRCVRFLAHVEALDVGFAMLVGEMASTPAVAVRSDGFTLACVGVADMWGECFLSLVAISDGEQTDGELARRLRLRCLPASHVEHIFGSWTGLIFTGDSPPHLEPYDGPLTGEYFNLTAASEAVMSYMPRTLARKLGDLCGRTPVFATEPARDSP